METFEICDNKGQVIFEALTVQELVEWYDDMVEDDFNFSGYTANGEELEEVVSELFMIMYAQQAF